MSILDLQVATDQGKRQISGQTSECSELSAGAVLLWMVPHNHGKGPEPSEPLLTAPHFSVCVYNLFLFYVYKSVFLAYMFVCYMCVVPVETRRECRILLELESRVNFKPPCRCWELNLGLLEEQPFLLIAFPSLYILIIYYMYYDIHIYDIYHKYFRQYKGTDHIEAPIHGM